MNFISRVLNILSVSKENSMVILSRSRTWSTKGTVLEQCSILGFTSSSNAKKLAKLFRIYVHYLEKWYNRTFPRKYSEGYFHFNVIVNFFHGKSHTDPYRHMGSDGLHLSTLGEWNKVFAKPLHSFWMRRVWRLGRSLLTGERQMFHLA